MLNIYDKLNKWCTYVICELRAQWAVASGKWSVVGNMCRFATIWMRCAQGAGCREALVPDGTVPEGTFCNEHSGSRSVQLTRRVASPVSTNDQ